MPTQYFIGINIGTTAVKSVLISKENVQWFFHKFNIVENEKAEGKEFQKISLLESIKKSLAGFDTKEARIICSIDNRDIYSVNLLMPRIPARELKEAILWEVKNQLPIVYDDIAIGYQPQGPVGDNKTEKKQRFLVTAARSSMIDNVVSLFDELGLKLFSILPSACALEHFLRAFRKELVSKNIALVDIGDSLTDLYVYQHACLQFSRRLPVTANEFVKSLMAPLVTSQGKMQLSLEEAQRVLGEWGVLQLGEQRLIEGKLNPVHVFSLLRPRIEQLKNEIERSCDYYRENHGGHIDEIVLLGGGAKIKGLCEYMTKELEIPVRVVDLSDGVLGESAGIEKESVHRLSVAFGAALSEGRGTNLIPTEYQDKNRRFIRQGCVLAGVLLMVVFLAVSFHDLTKKKTHIMKEYSKVQNEMVSLVSRFDQDYSHLAIVPLVLQSPFWEEVLKELSNLITEDIYLTELSMDGGLLLIKGRIINSAGPTEKLLSDFMLRLENGLFNSVRLVTTKEITTDSPESDFEISLGVD